MREQLWALGLDVPDTEDAHHHFGESVRLPGPHAIDRQQLHRTFTGRESSLLQLGSEGPILPPPSAAAAARNDANSSATPAAIEDVATHAQAKRNHQDKMLWRYGVKRQAPDTSDQTTPATTRRRLVPPTPTTNTTTVAAPPTVAQALGPTTTTTILPEPRVPDAAAPDDDGDEVFFDASEDVGR